MNPARLLAIDTSTERLAVALDGPGGEALTLDEEGGMRASSRLMEAVQELLRRAGTTLQGLDAVAFGRGPGAFTGLRTACAVAQGLALGRALPVLPIDSLLIVAEDARLQATAGAPAAPRSGHPFDIAVAMDARMDQVYAARYRHDGQRWTTTQAPALWDVQALAADWTAAPPARLAGTALAAFGGRLPRGAARCFEQEGARAAALLGLAHQAWGEGRAVDAALALPLYLRDKVAQTSAEREALRGAGAAGAAAPVGAAGAAVGAGPGATA